MTKQIHVIDQAGDVAIARSEVPAEVAQPTPVITPISQANQRKLDRKRMRRAKKEAKDIGYAMFTHIPDTLRNQLRDLVAIMRSISPDKNVQRIASKAMVDGLMAAGKEDR